MYTHSCSNFNRTIPIQDGNHHCDTPSYKNFFHQDFRFRRAEINMMRMRTRMQSVYRKLDQCVFEYSFRPGNTESASGVKSHEAFFIGKWHLGSHGVKGYQPQDHGFNILNYYDAGASVYFDWQKKWERLKHSFRQCLSKKFVSETPGELLAQIN